MDFKPGTESTTFDKRQGIAREFKVTPQRLSNSLYSLFDFLPGPVLFRNFDGAALLCQKPERDPGEVWFAAPAIFKAHFGIVAGFESLTDPDLDAFIAKEFDFDVLPICSA